MTQPQNQQILDIRVVNYTRDIVHRDYYGLELSREVETYKTELQVKWSGSNQWEAIRTEVINEGELK